MLTVSIFTFLLNPLLLAYHILPLKIALTVLLSILIFSLDFYNYYMLIVLKNISIQVSPEFHTCIFNGLLSAATWMIGTYNSAGL